MLGRFNTRTQKRMVGGSPPALFSQITNAAAKKVCTNPPTATGDGKRAAQMKMRIKW